MGLSAGVRLGAFEIVALVGAGGMGEVYRARDTRLNRDVALKVLPDAVAANPERLARFTREAQTLASLNHPGIAHVYGLERADAPDSRAFIVMEFVDGEDLAERIGRGPVPVDESIAIAAQITDALETAHEHGIIHRDLKPANVKVRRDGVVKLLDFGLAKTEVPESARAGLATASPTLTSPAAMTGAGVILGTAAYMAPEQAKGQPVDKRADIWAFGVVLYEMLTGRRLFASDSVAETVGLVMMRDPDWTALPPTTPPRVRTLLRRCLTKEPRNRMRDIGDARILLAESDEPAALPAAAGSRRAAAIIAATAIVTSIVAVTGVMTIGRRGSPSASVPLRRFELPPALAGAVISYDGNRLAYIDASHLRVRALDSLESQDLGLLPADAANLFWSPDGSSIGYTASAEVRTIRTSGGPPFVVCRVPATGNALSVRWRPDGTILMAVYRDSLYSVPATGGTPNVFLAVNLATEVDFHRTTELPGNRLLIATHLRDSDRERGDRERYEVYDGTRRSTIAEAASLIGFVYAEPGYLLFARTDANSGVWAVPFADGPLDLSKSVRIEPGAGRFSAAADGTIVATFQSPSSAELVWIDRKGAATPVPGTHIEIRTAAPRRLAVSPDGRRAVFTGGDQSDLFVRDLASGVDTRLTFNQQAIAPAWSPDGGRVLYASDVRMRPSTGANATGTSYLGKIIAQRADGTDRPHELADGSNVPRITPDGKSLLFIVDDNGRGRLRVAPLAADGSVGTIGDVFQAEDGPNVRWFDLSPDGRLLAYVAEDPTQRLDVFVTEFPGASGRWQVHAGGNLAKFSPSGNELFYMSGGPNAAGDPRGHFNVVSIASGPPVRIGAETTLFDLGTPQSPTLGAMGYSFAPDGKRMLAARAVGGEGTASRRVVLIQNWQEELKRRTPAR